MSLSSKQLLLRDAEHKFGQIFPSDKVNEILKGLTELFSYYDVERLADNNTDNDFAELLGAFIDAKRIEGRSEKTIERYQYILKRFYKSVHSPNRKDIDFQSLECTVLGKGNKERTVYLDTVAAMQLKSYLDSRTDDCEALFSGKGTDRLHPGGVRKRLNEIAASAGVENVHPHRFRRTLATNLITHGMPIQEVATILGHDKIDTTMTYVYLDKQSVKNSYRKYI